MAANNIACFMSSKCGVSLEIRSCTGCSLSDNMLRSLIKFFCLPCGKEMQSEEEKVCETDKQAAEPTEELTLEVDSCPADPWVPVKCHHHHHRRRRPAAVSDKCQELASQQTGAKCQAQLGRFKVVPVAPEIPTHLCRKKRHIPVAPEEEPWEWDF